MSDPKQGNSRKEGVLDESTKRAIRDLIREGKTGVDDATRLAIRDIIREEFQSPPATLHKEIEAEVRARIRRQEWYYYFIAAIAGAALIWVFHVEFAKIPGAVDEALKSSSDKIAADKIATILTNSFQRDVEIQEIYTKFKAHVIIDSNNLSQIYNGVQSTADQVNLQLVAIPGTLNTNVVTPFAQRLQEISRNDNLVTYDDMSKLFVRELVTNTVEHDTFVLSYEPIPQSVKFYTATQIGIWAYHSFPLDQFGVVVGHSVILTNKTQMLTSQVLDHSASGIVFEYVRKSNHN